MAVPVLDIDFPAVSVCDPDKVSDKSTVLVCVADSKEDDFASVKEFVLDTDTVVPC